MDQYLIIIILAILGLQQYKKYRPIVKQQRQDVLANYKAAERIGKYRLKVSEETGVVFESDTVGWLEGINWFKKITVD